MSEQYGQFGEVLVSSHCGPVSSETRSRQRVQLDVPNGYGVLTLEEAERLAYCLLVLARDHNGSLGAVAEKPVDPFCDAVRMFVEQRRVVMDWMDAEGKCGRLRTNAEAPTWHLYKLAEREMWEAINGLESGRISTQPRGLLSSGQLGL